MNPGLADTGAALPQAAGHRGVIALCTGMLAALLIWAAVAEVEVVITARAVARPADGIYEIRAPAPGMVRDIRVVDGAQVAQGATLIELGSDASLERLQAIEVSMGAWRRQLSEDLALLQAVDGPAPDVWPGSAEVRWQRLTHVLARLDLEAEATAGEIDAGRTTMAALQRRERTARFRHRGAERAFARKAISRLDLLRSQESLWLVQDEITATGFEVEVLTRRHAAQRYRREEALGSFVSELKASVSEAEVEIARLAADLAEARHQLNLARIEAPAQGIVEQLTAMTGDVVERGQVLGLVVPRNLMLIFEARIDPAENAFLDAGQRCRLKLDALPFVRYGAIPCVLERVGLDTVVEQNGTAYYPARVRPLWSRLQADQTEVVIDSGATAWVDIVAGQRSVLEFLTEPLRRFAREALRER